MALVAYDDSSDEEFNQVQSNQSNGTCVLIKNDNYPELNIRSNQSQSLFSSLPPPKVAVEDQVDEADDEFLHKKEIPVQKPNKRIQINIPSLSGYSSEEDERPPDKKAKKAVSGLFAVLPPPKFTPLSNTSFVPNVIQKKVNKPPSNKPLPKRQPSKVVSGKPLLVPINLQNGYHSDSNDDEDIEIPETFDDEIWQKVCGKKKKTEAKEPVESPTTLEQVNVSVVAAPEVEKPYSGLDNKAFKELVGSSKRIPHNIKLIDIHEDAIRPDKEVWLKSLTDPNFEAETVVENDVDNTRKSRNHITALAQKALANDKELQMRWSENRFNRKQTQANTMEYNLSEMNFRVFLKSENSVLMLSLTYVDNETYFKGILTIVDPSDIHFAGNIASNTYAVQFSSNEIRNHVLTNYPYLNISGTVVRIRPFSTDCLFYNLPNGNVEINATYKEIDSIIYEETSSTEPTQNSSDSTMSGSMRPNDIIIKFKQNRIQKYRKNILGKNQKQRRNRIRLMKMAMASSAKKGIRRNTTKAMNLILRRSIKNTSEWGCTVIESLEAVSLPSTSMDNFTCGLKHNVVEFSGNSVSAEYDLQHAEYEEEKKEKEVEEKEKEVEEKEKEVEEKEKEVEEKEGVEEKEESAYRKIAFKSFYEELQIYQTTIDDPDVHFPFKFNHFIEFLTDSHILPSIEALAQKCQTSVHDIMHSMKDLFLCIPHDTVKRVFSRFVNLDELFPYNHTV
ncbi:hypothetical protein FQR65_LT08241 [Abscondita terminalis]|nr:hypothetical protein FQR65_LT08241 [Abscondita terminalis]